MNLKIEEYIEQQDDAIEEIEPQQN